MFCTDTETHTARKVHRCDSCGELIQPGEVYKRWRCYDDTVCTCRMHPECLQMHQDDADGYSWEFSRWGNERPPRQQEVSA